MTGYLFVAPGLVLMTVFLVIPILFSFYISFYNWNGLTPLSRARYLGLDNYQRVLSDATFQLSIINTLKYAAGMVVLTLFFALILALALNGSIRFKGVFRTVYFIPVVTSMVAVSIVWSYIYHPTYGLLNDLLTSLGFGRMGFLTDTRQSLYSVMLVDVWKRIGYFMVIFIAGLQAIPRSLYEAAQVDGANGFQGLVKITLPMLKPSMLLATVVATIEALRVFTPVFVMTKGGPAESSMVAVLHMYNTAFSYLRMGRASAMAFLLFILVFLVTLIQMRLMREGGVRSWE